MKKVTWLPFDLQFFAEGEGASEGAEEAGAAEQPEGETGAEGAEEDSEEGEEQPEEDRDAIYAQARRRAESEVRERIAKEQAEEDAYWVRECQGKVNPETGAPITSYADYKEALEAQKRVAMKTELQNKGVDPSIIERYVAASPAIQNAQRMAAQAQEREVQLMLQEDIKDIMQMDKSFADEEALRGSEEFAKAVERCRQTPGLRLSEAYKLVNFNSLRADGVKAARQAAINEAKGKSHLVGTPNNPTGDIPSEIPEGDMWRWKAMYPDKTPKELNAIYQQVQSKK